jgi:excisionase family DNA binding protein
MNALAYTVSEACSAARIGRSTLYQLIATGELRALKRGRRTLILADDLRRFIESLPAMECRQSDGAEGSAKMAA